MQSRRLHLYKPYLLLTFLLITSSLFGRSCEHGALDEDGVQRAVDAREDAPLGHERRVHAEVERPGAVRARLCAAPAKVNLSE